MASTQTPRTTYPEQPQRSGRPWQGRSWFRQAWGWLLASWPVKGFREAEASNLAAIIAFNAIVALVPTVFLLVSIAGLVMRQEAAREFMQSTIYWALPGREASEALQAALA